MAAEAIVSVLLEQLASITLEKAQRQISLVGDVKKEVKKLTTNLQAIKAVLVDAEKRQVQEETVKFWLDELKDISYDMADLLDEWNIEILKLQIEGGAHEIADHHVSKKKVCCFLPSFCSGIKQIPFRHDIALRIEEINEKISDIAERKNNFNFCVTRSNEKSKRVQKISLVDESEIYGRNDEKSTLVSKLLCESSMAHQGLHVISIVGMGGIGKTTLAQLAYNNNEVKSYFQKRAWVSVSDPFDEIRIAKAIIKALKATSEDNDSESEDKDSESEDTASEELEYLMKCILKSIKRKKIFLVLDDVWTDDYNKWEPFDLCLKNGGHGSKILITTRNEAVARMMKSIHIMTIHELSKEYCESLFKSIAFFGRSPSECEKLEKFGEKIVEKCKGLPLAIKTIGSFLRYKETREEWQSILEDEMWKSESFERGIFPPLLLSYNDLPPTVKSCFLYCAIFPKDWEIDRNELIHLWMAQGYLPSNQKREMEIIGEEYFDILASRSFFQEFKKDGWTDYNILCKMHDIVHDVALFLSRKEYLAVEDKDFEKISPDKTRHLMFTMTGEKNYPRFSVNIQKLHSLLIERNRYSMGNGQSPLNMKQLTHLRALSLDSFLVEKISRDIAKLVHLRFLNIFVTGGTEEALPDALCELYNLQTLRIDGSTMFERIPLTRLPLGMEKLIKLRHLILLCPGPICMPKGMPKGIEKLTSLQTLTDFIVNGSGGDGNNACTLEALKNLDQLRGSLFIRRLGNVKDAIEIQKAELWKKKNLLELGLDFDGTMGGHDDHEILLKAFQPPPPNFEALMIWRYKGKIVSPNWMMSLSTLKKLRLRDCGNWECLPPLGIWPYLESLEIGDMWRIKRLSNEFLDVESGGASSSSSSSSSSSNIIFFPKLKSLIFGALFNWEEWDYGITRKDEEHSTIMPHLQYLEFLLCPKLKVLPEELFQRTTLEELKVDRESSQILKERYEEWSNRRKAQRLSTSN